MLFIAIVLVFLIYAGLYLMWDAARVSLDSQQAILKSLTNALLMPDNVVFLILRGLLMASLFYVVADYCLHITRRALKNSRRTQQERRLSATFQERTDQTYGE